MAECEPLEAICLKAVLIQYRAHREDEEDVHVLRPPLYSPFRICHHMILKSISAREHLAV